MQGRPGRLHLGGRGGGRALSRQVPPTEEDQVVGSGRGRR